MLAAIACPAGTIADAPPGTSDRSEVCGCPAPVVLQWPWPSSTYERWLEKLDQALFRSLPGTYLATVFDNDMQQRKMDENRALHQMTGGGAPPSHSEKLQPLGSSIANMLHMSHEVLGITNASLEAVRREPELSQKFNNNMHLLPYEVATPEVADATHNSFADSDVPFLYMAGFSPANVASLRWLCTTFVPALAAFGQGYQLHILG